MRAAFPTSPATAFPRFSVRFCLPHSLYNFPQPSYVQAVSEMKLSIRLVLAVAAAAIVPSRGEGCSFVCTHRISPVCGSDGRTYASQCQLESMNCNSLVEVTVKFEGECDRAELEPLTRLLSETPHEKRRLRISLSSACHKACLRFFAPVCGSDGITYGNRCLLEIAQCESGNTITQTSKEFCPDPYGIGLDG